MKNRTEAPLELVDAAESLQVHLDRSHHDHDQVDEVAAPDVPRTEAGPRPRTGRRGPAPRSVLAVALRSAQLGLVSVLVCLVALVMWTLLLLALGWSPHAVVSGSMSPSIDPGDVLLVQEAPAQVGPGSVVVFRDPGDSRRVIAHRVRAVWPDGRLQTRGDANPIADTTLVAPADVVGIARLRVPWVGLPAAWWAQGRYERLALAMGLVTAACAAAVWRSRAVPAAGAGLPPTGEDGS